MVGGQDIEKKRSVKELSEYIRNIRDSVIDDKVERHLALQKKELYKHHVDEMVPLASFCEHYYTRRGVEILPVLGNQPYDAEVYKYGILLEKIELTLPHDGATQAVENKQVVSRGWSDVTAGRIGREIEELLPYFKSTAKKKSQKNYKNCVLVFFLKYKPPFEGYDQEEKFEKKIMKIIDVLGQFRYNARSVYLFDMTKKEFHLIQKPVCLGRLIKKILS